MQEFLEIFCRGEGHSVETAGDVPEALLWLENDDFDVVITDMQMPGGTGLDVLRAAQSESPETVVVMITAFASTESAIQAMKHGAYDYITKPFKLDEIRVVVDKALEKKKLAAENQSLRTQLGAQIRQRAMIGASACMQDVFEMIGKVASAKANVLVTGESGTGKEIVARAVHASGERCDAPLVAINCSAIPENLIESELFGHMKGAFTGADQNKPGLFEVADGGTLFLDEVGELTLALQVKLLRVLQEKTIRRVGGNTDRAVDVRIVAATNQRLDEEVAKGTFREDLYYRLNVIEIPLPPLRQRADDIPLLVQHFVEKYSEELDKRIDCVSKPMLDRLMAYEFPGNVRELENIVERAVALTTTCTIDVDSLPPSVTQQSLATTEFKIPSEGVDLTRMIEEFEGRLLREALRNSGGVKKRAARMLGISFRSFRYRLEKLGIESERGTEG
ncbi:sigma-54 dependent transcriptional regulator [Myxococcota bacterium]|nr:sigma-54 dependent transcriptional regulator [Myxococcota bacterium]